MVSGPARAAGPLKAVALVSDKTKLHYSFYQILLIEGKIKNKKIPKAHEAQVYCSQSSR
jgi:hypothetical protein